MGVRHIENEGTKVLSFLRNSIQKTRINLLGFAALFSKSTFFKKKLYFVSIAVVISDLKKTFKSESPEQKQKDFESCLCLEFC